MLGGRSVLSVATLAVSLVLCGLTPLRAEPVEVHSDYSVSLAGLPMAYASFVTQVDGASYTISGDVKTSAFADILSKVRGNASVSGTLAEDRLLAKTFLVSYSSGKDAHRTEIQFSNGNVKSATNTPKTKQTADDWVPLSAEDMHKVLDPLSGLVFPAGSKVCPRSLPIFDGQSRVTLHLSPISVRPYSTKGFKGDAIVCSIRFEPKAGYRKGSSGIRYLKQLKDMEIWFAEHQRGGFYAPVYAKVPTKVGLVIVAATRFGG
ncbi:DUF3108 domain-containing protein [uncultured Hoeflea sp.]|uniref:DUF3108 domain-containing protein n=1 Tax=uncultured Hoeflea sp. TaxID=538666 RepID=UPI0030EF220C|tara:strand:- start:5949 stop:6734 length:786 start_codon:yes stop_codon:yes gene_type:complete